MCHPRVQATREIGDIRQTPGLKEARRNRRSPASLAVQHYGSRRVELSHSVWQQRQRNVNRIGQMTSDPLLRTPYIDYLNVVLDSQGGELLRVDLGNCLQLSAARFPLMKN